MSGGAGSRRSDTAGPSRKVATGATSKGPDKAKGTSKSKSGARGVAKRKPKRKAPRRPDPSDTDDAEVRFVQPYQATKAYLCPGCNREIPEGMGHMVAVPPAAPDLRRHWHRGCWNNRQRRR